MHNQEEQLNFSFMSPEMQKPDEDEPRETELLEKGSKERIRDKKFYDAMFIIFGGDKNWTAKVFETVKSNPAFYLSEGDDVIAKSILLDYYDHTSYHHRKKLIGMCKKIAKGIIQ